MGEEEGKNSGEAAGKPAGGKKQSLSIEKIYQKKSQLEHILLRPDTYIGSVERVTETMWVFDKEQGVMVQRDISYVPGLYKIFDEILVNAADNKQRDAKMDCIKIVIDPEENMISIWNNGEGIPVVEHKEEKMYVPTMIFGHLLTSSNYNDDEEKVTGGRNGYGAKLCNIFSDKFVVETSSGKYKRALKQTWTNNMSKESDVKIKESHSDDYTKITFYPDLTKFKMEKLDKDIVDLMKRRAYDVAASTRGVKVFLNGERLPVKTFKDYIDLYIKGKTDDAGNPFKIVYEAAGPRWEVAVTISEKDLQQVSFVNSIATTKGGRHVDYVTDMIVKQVIEQIKKKNKGGMQIKPFQVKQHMWLFVNCLIVNPTFDSQTKEHMTLQIKNFGSKCVLTEKFMSSVAKSGLVEQVLTWAKFKAQTILERASSGKKVNKLKGVPKLEDANEAGTKNSLSCTLILTEGDSAKTLAVAGLSVIGRDRYGVFPLRGKLLNVREATHKQILENAEINNIIKIMGLQYKKKYETSQDMATLRYGKIMIMTDQDQDGSHIKGLIVNFIHTNWPSLIKMPFLEVFITPLVKAFKKDSQESFFSLPEFEEWKSKRADWKSYRIKYYKGLGTSTSKEAKEYFNNMDRHQIKFVYSGPECDQHIVMAFSRKCIEQRKEWLTSWMAERKRRKELGLSEEYLYTKDTRSITYKDFINKELVLFSNMDNERSIPSMVDGFKPGQRKVLFTCFKRNDKREIKVAQLAGSVAEHSAYHHGEVSLMGTIINLAQNFVGSNNINLLQPIGQFGTRLQGGKDSASPRYIFTMLSPLARLIFHPHDDAILKNQFEDNQKIEPVWYMPIIPMVLVNGCDGIGTGWSTKIPNYNPREIVTNIKQMIDGSEPSIQLRPWYKGFRGDIDTLIEGKYVASGEVGIINEDKVEITELPVSVWTQNYKESVLEPMLTGTEKSPATITDYKEYHTDVTVRFVISMSTDKLNKAEEEGLHKYFKLQTTISTSSMCCFDQDICLRKYESVMDILQEFFNLRLEYYGKRKAYLVGMLEAEASKLSNQARFIMEKCSGQLTVENKKKGVIIKELIDKKYASDPVKEWKQRQKSLEEQMAEAGLVGEDEEDEDAAAAVSSKKSSAPAESGPDFDYLLGMSLWSLTLERKEELINKKNEKLAELDALKMKTPGDMWTDDLDKLLEKLDDVEKKERNEQIASMDQLAKPKTGKGAKELSGKKKMVALSQTQPNPKARRIMPVIAEDLKKRAEFAVKAKERKQIKALKKDKGEDDGEEDEFDKLEKEASNTLASRLKLSPTLVEKKGQRKKKDDTETSPKKKGKKRAKNFSDSDESLHSEFSDEDVFASKVSAPAQPSRTTARRSAASAVQFKFDSGSESSQFSDSEIIMKPVIEKAKKVEPVKSDVDASGSDSDFASPKKNGNIVEESSDQLFDSLLANDKKEGKTESGSDQDFVLDSPVKKKPAKVTGDKEKKPRAKPKKKTAAIGSDSEEDAAPKKPKAKPKKKAADAGSDSDEDAAPKKPKAKAAKRPKKKASDSDDDSPPKKAAPKKKKKKMDSSDDDIVMSELSDESPVIRQPASSRARKPVSYKLDQDSDDASE